MLLLFKKYIIKEILLYFIAIIALLFFVSIANTFISLLTKVASGKLPFGLACKIILLYTPESLGLLIPVSLFIANLFVISKLYADNEIVVLFMSGLSWKFLIITVTIITSIISIITASLTLYINPITAKLREELLYKGESLGFISAIMPGSFQLINEDKQIFYVGNINNEQIQDVFIATNIERNTDPLIITAKSGQTQILEDQEGSFLVLQNGHRYSGIVGSDNFSIIDFSEYGRQILPKNHEVPLNTHRLQKTRDIWRSVDAGETAEWQWRISMPISVFVLSILAISLAKVSPRQGRFAKFLPAILLYIIYCNAMIFMRRLLVIGAVNRMCGMWVIHGGFLILAIVLLLQSSGWLLYFRKKYFKYENYC